MADPVSISDFVARRNAELTAERDSLNIGGGDGTSGGMGDDWKESVDRQLGQLHADIRALLNRGVIAVVALAAMVGGLYLYTNAKFDAIGDRLAAVEVAAGRLDEHGKAVDQRLDAMDKKLDAILDRLPSKK